MLPEDPQTMVRLTRTTGPKNRRLLKYLDELDRTVTPDRWLAMGDAELRDVIGLGCTIEEAIAIRIKWCLVTNTRFNNAPLLKELLDRNIGKVPLRILTKPEETPEDFEDLTDAEITKRQDELLLQLGTGSDGAENQSGEGGTPGDADKAPDGKA